MLTGYRTKMVYRGPECCNLRSGNEYEIEIFDRPRGGYVVHFSYDFTIDEEVNLDMSISSEDTYKRYFYKEAK
ncbi:hypothetical protein SAMN05216391_10896 [Lachnospiraceae bacterium KHCPX20]|nr:hypothetical protein SAMN05216391_10896 [Lachnospiraceae bacterium KHCPX20]